MTQDNSPHTVSYSYTIKVKEEHIDKVFDPFYTTKPGPEGTGLGLALCSKIMLEHGGSIDVYSKEGIGTTFTLRFPKVK